LARIQALIYLNGQAERDDASSGRGRVGGCLVEGRRPSRSRSLLREGQSRRGGKWSGNWDRNTPSRHRAHSAPKWLKFGPRSPPGPAVIGRI